MTTNKLLSVMPDAIGIKTGTTDKAGHNLSRQWTGTGIESIQW